MIPPVKIPAGLWQHALFSDSAIFIEPRVPLAIARVESHLRRIRNMPSAGDSAAPEILKGLRILTDWASRIIPRLPTTPPLTEYLATHERIEKIMNMPGTGDIKSAGLRGLARVIPPEFGDLVPAPDVAPAEMHTALRFLDFALLDACLCAMPASRKAYLRLVYRLAADALQYNATTDAPRMLPALTWVRHLLQGEKRRGLSYVDVGCAFAGGAPALKAAVKVLRPDNVCRVIHGTDITPPMPDLRLNCLREHRVGIYRTDPVSRPLPRRYDVIMLANMHRHLDHELQRRLLTHLAWSLNEDGRLFITWRFDARDNPCMCITRHGAALKVLSTVNLV